MQVVLKLCENFSAPPIKPVNEIRDIVVETPKESAFGNGFQVGLFCFEITFSINGLFSLLKAGLHHLNFTSSLIFSLQKNECKIYTKLSRYAERGVSKNSNSSRLQVLIQTPAVKGKNALSKESLLKHVEIMEEVAKFQVEMYGELVFIKYVAIKLEKKFLCLI